MHSSTLFLVALASLMVSFTSAKVIPENSVHVAGIHQGSNAMHFNKRNMDKRTKLDPNVSTDNVDANVSADNVDANVSADNVDANVSTDNVDTSAPAANVDTNPFAGYVDTYTPSPKPVKSSGGVGGDLTGGLTNGLTGGLTDGLLGGGGGGGLPVVGSLI